MEQPPKSRARSEILHYVLSFTTSRIFGAADAQAEYPRTSGGLTGFVSAGRDTPVEIGDLVLLQSAPASKWRLGWLREMRPLHSDTQYLIESLDDGELCWWRNVSIAFLQRRCVLDRWQWTDRQFAFADRWNRVCYKERDAYIVRPVPPVFGEEFAVTLGTRTSHGFDDIRPSRTFTDWRKVTKAMMAQCYDECVAERSRIITESKAA